MKRTDSARRHKLLADETSRLSIARHGGLRVGIGYPNSYRVALSSLAFQWIVELSSRTPGIGVERFVAEPGFDGRSLDSGDPLGRFSVLAWTCSFELDATNLLKTLDAAGVPRRSDERNEGHPLIVVGGPVACINPLPLAPAVDVFCLGAAELIWQRVLQLAADHLPRAQILETLAKEDGYFVPLIHLDASGRPLAKHRRLEKRDAQMVDPRLIPSSHLVTPNTEYANRALVEVSRGCPEKCRYCWVSHNYGRLRYYPAEGILDRIGEAGSMSGRVGLVATAVGDHPQLAAILEYCRSAGLNVALSSLRIPAMVPEILQPLADSGTRSLTIAPETGSDDLRRQLNKPIPNQQILEAVAVAQRCGIPNLKMYFIIGLPGETDNDLEGIAKLARDAHEIMLSIGRPKGRVGELRIGVSILVPKPYTPYARKAMISATEARRRIAVVQRGLRGVGNVRLDRPSYREAMWQAYLSRGDTSAYDLLERAADGAGLGRLMADHRSEIEASCLSEVAGDPVWQFISSAPTRRSRGQPGPG